MTDYKRKIPFIGYFLIGLALSALFGIADSQILLTKAQQYRENMLWKTCILLYLLTMGYTFWLYFSESYLPVFVNLLKFLATNFLLTLPFFTILMLTETASLKKLLTFLPAQIIFLATIFIFYVVHEINPERVDELKHMTIVVAIISGIAVLLLGGWLPDILVLSLAGLIPFSYVLLLLITSK